MNKFQNLPLNFLLYFALINNSFAKEIFTTDFERKSETNTNKVSDDFFCIKSSKKYIPGRKIHIIQLGDFKFNLLKLDGFKKVTEIKCKLND
tara:strand:- start:778 stop:1053 length:276 start_codon:yes stop_codon:yes gene_type:complete